MPTIVVYSRRHLIVFCSLVAATFFLSCLLCLFFPAFLFGAMAKHKNKKKHSSSDNSSKDVRRSRRHRSREDKAHNRAVRERSRSPRSSERLRASWDSSVGRTLSRERFLDEFRHFLVSRDDAYNHPRPGEVDFPSEPSSHADAVPVEDLTALLIASEHEREEPTVTFTDRSAVPNMSSC